jgi:tRNA (mo5U34)-methyltransferase
VSAPSDIPARELRARVAAIRWHHTIDLGGGVVTPGGDNSARKLARLGLPPSLAGRTVLDVGAWDGFFSFEAERRGADRVLATDSFIWDGGEPGMGKDGFDLAKRALGSRVEERRIDVMDLSPATVGTWDVVLFLGVLYHLRHPLLALERVASVTGGVAIIETVVDMLDVRRPAIAFYEDDRLARDATNWCGPNVPALEAMLRAAGFARVEVVAPPRGRAFRLAKALHYRRTRGFAVRDTLRTDRVVVHAWTAP